MDPITKYLHRIAYKFPKGYPDVNNPEEKAMLISLVEQQLSLFSDEELAAMIKKDTGVDIENIDNETELKDVFNKMSPELKKKIKN